MRSGSITSARMTSLLLLLFATALRQHHKGVSSQLARTPMPSGVRAHRERGEGHAHVGGAERVVARRAASLTLLVFFCDGGLNISASCPVSIRLPN